MNYCKNCGHAEVVHRFYDSRDQITWVDEWCTILDCDCKNYEAIEEDKKE